MVAFTMARKAGLAHYLKPHQYSIALGSAWTVLLSFLGLFSDSAKAFLGASFFASCRQQQTNFSHAVGDTLHFAVWVPTGCLYLSSLVSRKEIDLSPTGWLAGGFLALLCVAQLAGCGTSMSLALVMVSLILGGTTAAMYKGRVALLMAAWTGCTVACYLAEEGGNAGPAPMLFVVCELLALLVVKIAHPALDGPGDVDLGNPSGGAAAASSGQWIW
jgi:hypothetical protein